MNEGAVRAAFAEQAGYCEQLGSHITGRVLRAAGEILDRATVTGRRLLDWPGDPRAMGDNVPLRLAGGLHALARRGADAALSDMYAGRTIEARAVAAAMASVLRRHDAALLPWLDTPPQTNEVGRSAAIMAGLLVLAAEHRLPFELIELGASAGLNLNLDRFGYRLGETIAGDKHSPLQLAPDWHGASPPTAEVRIVARQALDRSPIDVRHAAERERLIAYVWPDQPERLALLEAALAIAVEHPPVLEQGDAADFVERALAYPQPDRIARVIFHTIFWTYLPPESQARIEDALAHAGGLAERQRPLAWLRYEMTGESAVPALDLTSWPGGETRRLATGHPHGTWLNWTFNPLRRVGEPPGSRGSRC